MVAEINVARVEDVVVLTIPGTEGKHRVEMTCQVRFLEMAALDAKRGVIPMGTVYPVGDIQQLVDRLLIPGSDPGYIVKGGANLYATPLGVVLELSDPATGEMARSMPVPWARFDGLLWR